MDLAQWREIYAVRRGNRAQGRGIWEEIREGARGAAKGVSRELKGSAREKSSPY